MDVWHNQDQKEENQGQRQMVTSPAERMANRLGVTQAEIAAAIRHAGLDQDRIEDYLRAAPRPDRAARPRRSFG